MSVAVPTVEYEDLPSNLLKACYHGDVRAVADLLNDSEAQVDAVTPTTGRNALHIACSEGHVDIVTILCADGRFLVNAGAAHDETPFYCACVRNQLAVVRMLYRKGVDIELPDDFRRSPFYAACMHGQYEVVDWLVKVDEPPVKVNATNKHGFTPLNAAATGGYQRVVTRLLALPGVNVNKPTYSDNSPLLMACMQEHAALVQLLLEEPRADIVARPTNWRSSALHAACIGGDVGIIGMLLADDRVDVNACTPADHVSPFFHACACGKLAAVKYLAEHTDADINLPNNDGVTPFQAACSNNRVDVVTYLASDSRVDTAASSSRGQSAFFQACRSGALTVAKKLVAEGRVHVLQCTRARASALYAACDVGRLEVVRWLSGRPEFAALANLATTRGTTCFHAACMSGQLSVVQWLAGDDRVEVCAVDHKGFTPLMQAARSYRMEVVSFLAGDNRMWDETGSQPPDPRIPSSACDILMARRATASVWKRRRTLLLLRALRGPRLDEGPVWRMARVMPVAVPPNLRRRGRRLAWG